MFKVIFFLITDLYSLPVTYNVEKFKGLKFYAEGIPSGKVKAFSPKLLSNQFYLKLSGTDITCNPVGFENGPLKVPDAMRV